MYILILTQRQGYRLTSYQPASTCNGLASYFADAVEAYFKPLAFQQINGIFSPHAHYAGHYASGNLLILQDNGRRGGLTVSP